MYLTASICVIDWQDERRGVYVKGLTCRQAENEEDALNMLFEVQPTPLTSNVWTMSIDVCIQGERNRTIAEHALNKHSSRSHCIFTITVEVIHPLIPVGWYCYNISLSVYA